MPRLPSAESLGERPIPVSRGRVAEIDATVQSRALAQVGGAVNDLGQTLFRIDQEITKSRRSAQLAEIMGKATQDLTVLEMQYQKDPEFTTSATRFAGDAKQIADTYGGKIDDQVVLQSFRQQFGRLAQAKQLNVLKDAVTKEQDVRIADLDNSLDVYARSAAQAKNPVERDAVVNQAIMSISTMESGRWITSQDAAKRGRQFAGKIEQYTVLEDMRANPSGTADRLVLDPEYVPNLDPVQRERFVDMSYRRAESDRVAQERMRKQAGDQLLSEAWSRSDNGTLNRGFIEYVRPYVSPSEYRMLLNTLREGPEKDDTKAFIDLMDKLQTDPQEAERLAFHYREVNQITNATMKSVLTSARSKGPKPTYEREKERVTLMLKPPPMATDPAPYARQGLALQEFDDYVVSGKRTDEELRAKADEVVKKYSLINMRDLAIKTAPGARADEPDSVLNALKVQATKLNEDYKAKRISEEDYRKKMSELNAARRMAEKASGE